MQSVGRERLGGPDRLPVRHTVDEDPAITPQLPRRVHQEGRRACANPLDLPLERTPT